MTGDADIAEGGGEMLVLVQHVEASPADVWDCFTHPDCFKAWWREDAEFDAAPDGRFRAPWAGRAGRDGLAEAQVVAYHPPHGLVMVWANEDWSFDTVVSISIEPDRTGSLVTLEHQGWQAAPEPDRATLLLDHREGWTAHLAQLAHHAKEHDARRKGH
ncbi:SRPBCC domain-containing protein [Aurantimonas sp. Leaf443]|uniref:SRPBCC family protein n=1 Tax=Aurantimonas sp. Leaf443 TaxID=1736378 RepID=UPI0006F712B4|nr:SRPBCC domain-containing protein [Aurantimonas sp. Leaf443]KQT83464.1 hypothetical protein ASG48_12980 [Aurantimonas sp. Leaf443]